ncbi:MAG: CapA family protein [Candidatus Omnitrophica bacterium]|nr:CapA family protein [Candidatus Omnitrophota bacterium]
MPLGNHKLSVDSKLREFIRSGDYFIANFEGTITDRPNKAFFSPSFKKHSRAVVKQLELFSPAHKTILCVSNNHACDFGKDALYASVSELRRCHFRVFGLREDPFIDINTELRIVSGTMWLNRACNYVSALGSAREYVKPGACTILFPHFGYEHEWYPRPAIVAQARSLLKDFDAVVGHHTHCPQPVTSESVGGVNKLLAYSLGNFIGAFKKKGYQSGIVLKVCLGKNNTGAWLVSRVEWRFIYCKVLPNGDCVVT